MDGQNRFSLKVLVAESTGKRFLLAKQRLLLRRRDVGVVIVVDEVTHAEDRRNWNENQDEGHNWS